PYTMKSDYQLARFNNEYQDQLLERQFLQVQPTDQQVEFFILNINSLVFYFIF
ncbi:unnamed protein product, partial [Rotaria magnacalcarata]